MATVKLNTAIKEIRGTLGDMVFTPLRDGEAIVRKKGKRPEAWSERQQSHQKQFAEASAYAKAVQADPELSKPYAARAKARRLAPYHLALGDYMRAPEVQEIDLSAFTAAAGSVIRVEAPEWKVVRMDVRILDLTGAVLEQGSALSEPDTGTWLYTLRGDAPVGHTLIIEATATDRPAHTGLKTAFWAARQ